MNSLFIAVSVGNIVINHQVLGGVYPESSPAGSRSGSHDPELSSLRTVSTAPGGWDFSGSGENLRGSSLVSSTINRWLVRFPQTTRRAQARRRSWCRTASAAGWPGAIFILTFFGTYTDIIRCIDIHTI